MFRGSILCLILAGALVAQVPAPSVPPSEAPAERPTEAATDAVAPASPVRVPTHPNSTCPIMGKKVSMPLFTDTEFGRIYICCKPCVRKIHADVHTAYKTAYPVEVILDNEVCPVSGEPIGEHAVKIALQGSTFSLCCAGCVERAQQHAQVTLARLHEPTLVDVGNQTCPISDQPVVANAFVVIEGSIVHLASPRLVVEVERAPAQTLEQAKRIAAEQPKVPAHEHVKAPSTTSRPSTGDEATSEPAGRDGDPRDGGGK